MTNIMALAVVGTQRVWPQPGPAHWRVVTVCCFLSVFMPLQDKLECTEELGDLISQVDANMALSVYLRANAAEKVVNSFSQRGEFDKMVAYASKVWTCGRFVWCSFTVQTV